MSSCNICLDVFKKPVSLPCGHIFCMECVVKTVQATRPQRNVHPCPTCRTPYSIMPLNPLVFPQHLRPFITPTVRRVYIDNPETAGESSTSPSPSSSSPPIVVPAHVSEELSRLRGENQTLHEHCSLWRRRAELHGAATLGLLDFARMVRDQAVGLARERDELQRRCQTYKRKLDGHDQPSEPECLPSPSRAFEFSCRGHHPRMNHSTPPAPSSSDPLTYPPATLEASRMAVAALFDLHSYMGHPSPPPLPPRQQQPPNQDARICHCPRPAHGERAVAPPSSMASENSALPSTAPTRPEQPPAKRVRRESEELERLEGSRTSLGTASGASHISGASTSASSSRFPFP